MKINEKELKMEAMEEVCGGGTMTEIGAKTIIAYEKNMAKGYDVVKAAFFAGVEGLFKGRRGE